MTVLQYGVSIRSLTFYVEERSSQRIIIPFAFYRNLGIEIDHNLPSSFTVEPKNVIPPCKMEIKYNPKHEQKPAEGLWIKFTDIIMEKHSYNPLIVKVNLLSKDESQAEMNEPIKVAKEEMKSHIEGLQPVSLVQCCRVCYHSFSSTDTDRLPRVLTGCGHSVCNKCIERMKKEHSLKASSGVLEKEGFPVNKALLQVLRVEAARNEAVRLPQHPPKNVLVPCFENENFEAEVFCRTCKANFCQPCFKRVHAPKIFSTHTCIPLAEKEFELPKCSTHAGNSATLLCRNEICTAPSRFCCSKCLKDLHKNHKIEKILEKVKQNEENLETILQRLNFEAAKMRMKIEEADRCVRMFDKFSREYLRAVDVIEELSEKKREFVFKNLDDAMAYKADFVMEEKAKLENKKRLIDSTILQIERILKRRETIFVDAIIKKGEELCIPNSKNVNFKSVRFPNVLQLMSYTEPPRTRAPDPPTVCSCMSPLARQTGIQSSTSTLFSQPWSSSTQKF
uniref:B box-type domain-containing protein n=1 Tax=Caenorhabditis tropicalis TaxID=1561998 RepID=A0A1I7UFI2_9PELO